MATRCSSVWKKRWQDRCAGSDPAAGAQQNNPRPCLGRRGVFRIPLYLDPAHGIPCIIPRDRWHGSTLGAPAFSRNATAFAAALPVSGSAHGRGASTSAGGTARSGADPSPTTHSGTLTTSCNAVVYVGDSTFEGVVSTSYLPDPGDREDARLRAVGVHTFIPQISGARAIVEHYQGQPSGADIVTGMSHRAIQAVGSSRSVTTTRRTSPSAAGRTRPAGSTSSCVASATSRCSGSTPAPS